MASQYIWHNLTFFLSLVKFYVIYHICELVL